MNVCVTGASGFIGRALVKELIRENHRVNAFVHERGLPEENLCRVYKGDICDSRTLRRALENVDVLYHLAAAMGASHVSEKEFFRVNKEGSRVVYEAAGNQGVRRCVHFSSAGVLGSVKGAYGVKEDYVRNPINVYDRSKLEGEDIALDFARRGMGIVVVRPGWVYGPGDRRTFKLIRAIAKKNFIFVTGKKAFQTPVYISDLVHGAVLCADKGEKAQIYHLAGNEIMTVRAICEEIAGAAGVSFPSFPLPLWFVKMVAFLLENGYKTLSREAPLTMGKLAFFSHSKPLSIGKAENELGYSPEHDFKTGISRTIEWYKAKGWLSS